MQIQDSVSLTSNLKPEAAIKFEPGFVVPHAIVLSGFSEKYCWFRSLPKPQKYENLIALNPQ